MQHDPNKQVEARLTFMRPTGTVEVEMFETEQQAKRWITARLRQLNKEGFATDPMHIYREVTKPRKGGA